MKIDFTKYRDGLVPAIIQDHITGKVLMLGFMNEASFAKTQDKLKVVFFSRSKQRLWMKGEESGNYLFVKDILVDCDNDTILIKADPAGPVCHTGTDTCFGEENVQPGFLQTLEKIIIQRRTSGPESSYTHSLFRGGINRIAQKVGEEAVEVVIAAKDDDKENLLDEAADLMFHYLVLLQAKGISLAAVEHKLQERHRL